MFLRASVARVAVLRPKMPLYRSVWKIPFTGNGQKETPPPQPLPPETVAQKSFAQRLWNARVGSSTPEVKIDKSTAKKTTVKKLLEDARGTVYDVEYWLSLVPDKIMGPKMKGTVRDLFKIAEELYGRFDRQPVHPLVLNIALLRLYANLCHHEQQEQLRSVQGVQYVDEQFTAEVLHHFNYASEVYGTDPLIRKQDILLNQLEDDWTLHLPRHVVFLDHLTKSIVVSIRGTKSMSDMITDLYIKEVPFLDPDLGVVAHRGIAQSAEALLPSVTMAINNVRQKENGRYASYRVVTTGHSLGAGTAVLLSMLLSTKSKIPVTSYAFAPPPVVSHPTIPTKSSFPFNLFSREVDCKIHCFVHDRDIIARCSHRELLHLLSALTAVDSLPWSDFDRAAKVFRGQLTSEEMDEIAAVLTKAQAEFAGGKDAALYLPGEVYLLRPVPTVKVEAVRLIPGAASPAMRGAAASADADDGLAKTQAEKAVSAWQQLVEKTASLRGMTVLSTRRATPEDLARQGHSQGQNQGQGQGPGQAKDDTGNLVWTRMNWMVGEEDDAGDEAGIDSEVRSTDPRAQYELVRVPSAASLFNGLLYCGDSMVHDHLLSSYRRALLKLVT